MLRYPRIRKIFSLQIESLIALAIAVQEESLAEL